MESIVKKPNLYDLLYQDVMEDISMYIKLLKGCQNILEFGAGTGRITIPLAENGYNVDAVDIEPDMLEVLSDKIVKDANLNKKIKVILGNMCGYESGKQYDAVIIPLTSFNYLLTEEEQLDCLKSVKNNLKDNGYAIIELLSKNTYKDVSSDDKYCYVKNINLGKDQYYKYYRKTNLNMAERKITQDRLFKLYDGEQFISEEQFVWNNRFVTIEDFKKVAERAGLYVENIYGNCDLEVYNERSEDVFIVVKKFMC